MKIRTTIRLDQETHKEISRLAKEDSRNFNNYVEVILKKVIKDARQADKAGRQG